MNLRANSLYSSVGGVVRLIAGIACSPLLVWLMGLSTFGMWSVLGAIVGIAMNMEFGISGAVNALLAGYVARGEKKEINELAGGAFLLITLFSAVTAAILFFGAPLLIASLFGEPRADLTASLRILAVSIVVRFWQTLGAAFEGALMRYDLQTVIELTSSLVIQFGSVIVAALGGRILELSILHLAITAATCVAHAVTVAKIWPCERSGWGYSRNAAGSLMRFGIAQWLTSVAATLFNQADRLIVNATLGPTVTGIYSAITSVANKIVEVSCLPLRVLPPTINAAMATDDFERIRVLFSKAASVASVFAFGCAAILIFWAEPIVLILTGHNLQGDPGSLKLAAMALRVAALIYAVNSRCVTSAWFVFGMARPFILARWAITGTLLMGIGIWKLSEWYGLVGAAWGNAGYLVTIGISFELGRLLGLSRRKLLVGFGPLVLALGVCWAVSAWSIRAAVSVELRAMLLLVCLAVGGATLLGRRLLVELVVGFFTLGRSALLGFTALESAASKPPATAAGAGIPSGEGV